MFPQPGIRSVPPLPHVRGFPALKVLRVSRTGTTAFVSLRSAHSFDVLGCRQDRSVSPRFPTLPSLLVPCSQTPPASPANIACIARLLLPSKYSTLSATGYCSHEAQSLHLRYGPSIALSTLNSCRYLHEPKTRFLVGRLIPLSRAGISPAGSAKLSWRAEVCRGEVVEEDGWLQIK
jgi:hypothetical protein